jgi:hypothetical protein
VSLIPTVPIPTAPPGPLLRLVDWMRVRFFPDAMDNVTGRWVAFLLILLVAFVIGRFGVRLVFAQAEKLSVKAKNRLMLPALEAPAATFVMLCGIIAALTVVPLWEYVPGLVWLGERGALTAVILWGLACAGGAMIDHFAEARGRAGCTSPHSSPSSRRRSGRSSWCSASSSSPRCSASR